MARTKNTTRKATTASAGDGNGGKRQGKPAKFPMLKPFSCSTCGKTFKLRGSWKRHLAAVHGEDVDGKAVSSERQTAARRSVTGQLKRTQSPLLPITDSDSPAESTRSKKSTADAAPPAAATAATATDTVTAASARGSGPALIAAATSDTFKTQTKRSAKDKKAVASAGRSTIDVAAAASAAAASVATGVAAANIVGYSASSDSVQSTDSDARYFVEISDDDLPSGAASAAATVQSSSSTAPSSQPWERRRTTPAPVLAPVRSARCGRVSMAAEPPRHPATPPHGQAVDLSRDLLLNELIRRPQASISTTAFGLAVGRHMSAHEIQLLELRLMDIRAGQMSVFREIRQLLTFDPTEESRRQFLADLQQLANIYEHSPLPPDN